MKRVNFRLFALAIALVASSCVKDVVVDDNFLSTPSEVICFGADLVSSDDTRSGSCENRLGNHILKSGDMEFPVGVYQQNGINTGADAETRGSVVNEVSAINQFNVWATFHKSDSESMSYFDNVAYKKDANGVFAPVNAADEYYWPGAGNLSFVAVANTPESGFTANASNSGVESFTYTVNSDPTKQPDVMLAQTTVPGSTNSSVPLKFDHIMSAVNVKIGSVVEGEIRSITFKNVYNKGEYLVDQGVWVVDKSSVGDFTVKMEDGMFVSTGTEASGTAVNTDDAVFMMIPQNPGENAEMVVEFYDKQTQTLYSGSTALRGSIAGDNWDKRKTTNYMLSIDESFTLTIEPVGKKLDAHYIIGYANVRVEGIPNWEITITAEGVSNSEISLLPEEEVNPIAKQGFWTDKVVDANNNITTESARGTNKYNGSGNVDKLFYLFIPENISEGDREIKLILRGTGESTASTTKVMLQKNPNWTTAGFGWEVVDDDESGTFGFQWTRKIAYIYPYSRLLAATARNHCQDFIDDYGAGTNNFATVGTISLGIGQNRAYILLDYTKLNNLTGADSATEGLNNTLALYRQAGTTATSQFETIVTTTMKTESGHEKENMFRYPTDNEISKGCPAESGKANDLSAIMEYVQKKNRYYLQKRTVSGDATGNAYVPYFVESDLKWYLPAYGQFQYFTPDPNIPGDDKANYWSSTAVNGATDSYIGDGTPKDRDLEYRVIAVRRDENGYGNVTVDVINAEEMAGGENGDAQWVEQPINYNNMGGHKGLNP